MTRHLLFTSSRDGVTDADVEAALRPLFAPGTILVCGAARGGDRIAARLWRDWGGQVDEHPVTAAEWQRSRGAGYARNAEMVGKVKAAGDAECLAVIARCASPTCPRTDPHGTHGAVHCAGLAEAAGIPVQRVKAKPQPPAGGETATPATLPASRGASLGRPGIAPDDPGPAASRGRNTAPATGPRGWPACPQHGAGARQAEAGS
jgi:hypothetical protein